MALIAETQINESMVCTVRVINGTQHPALRFQVTLKADNVKDGLIRFGASPGDELNGWWPVGDVLIDRELGYPTPDGKGFINK